MSATHTVSATVTMTIQLTDDCLTGLEVSGVLARHRWVLEDEVTGLLSYGVSGVRTKPAVAIVGIVVHPAR